MDSVVIEDPWASYFAGKRLRTFDDFYCHAETTTVNSNGRRDVQKLTFGQNANRMVFFMKRFHRPHLKDTLSTRRRFGQFISQAAVEWRNAQYQAKRGIDTYKPVCMGERTRWGFETTSFLVTRELDATCLLDFIIGHWRRLNASTQEEITVAMAKLALRLHALGVSFPDLCIWHLFIRPECPAGDCRLSIIDLHRMTQGIQSPRKKAKDVSRLRWSMLSDYFSAEHRQLLLTTYLGGFRASQRRSLSRAIERYEAILNKRRTAHGNYARSRPKSP